MIFCGKTDNKEKITPFIPSSLIKKPTVKPKDRPRKNTITKITGIPIIVKPEMIKIKAVFKLFESDTENTAEASTFVLFTLDKKPFINVKVLFV